MLRTLSLLRTALVVPFVGAGVIIAASYQPSARPATLQLNRFALVFDESFAKPSISARGPGTTWIAHTPWGGDFGDARFVDPRPGFPFTRANGSFRIEMMRRPDGSWESGLLASVDSAGHGFSMRYGYFELRARLPSGQGVWPAFWLDSMTPPGSTDPSLEVDVMEQYGQFPAAYNSTITLWPKNDQTRRWSQMTINRVRSGTLSYMFHTYGVDVEPDWTVFYFDRAETWRVRTPAAYRHPLMILIDLGLGGGWPIAQAPRHAAMEIDYVRAYASGRAP